MNLIWFVVIIGVGLAIALLLLMPATTRTTVSIRFDASIQEVWEVYTDFESQSSWRSDVASVEMSSDKTSWTEELTKSGMIIRFQLLEKIPPSKLVLQTSAESNFEGRYIAEFKQENGGTVGTFTEEATALGILPKVMRRLFFKQEKFIEEYAKEAKAEIEKRKLN